MKIETVHKLIMTLSPAEKRQFTMLFSGPKEKKYLRLYGLLNQDTPPTQAECRNALPATDPVLHRLLQHLFECLLKMLEDSEEFGELRQIRHAGILLNRGLRTPASIILERAKKSLQRTEDYGNLIQVLNLEIKACEDPQEARLLSQELVEAAQAYRTELELIEVRQKLQLAPKARDADSAIFFASLRSSPVLHVSPDSLGWRAKLDYLKCWRGLHTFGQNHSAALEFSKKLLEHLAPRRKEHFVAQEWVDEQHALVKLLILTGNQEQARNEVFRLLSFESGSPAIKAKVWEVSTSLLLAWAIDDLDLEAGEGLLEGLQKGLEVHKEHLDSKVAARILFFAVKFSFIIQDYEGVLTWLKRLESAPGESARSPLLFWARMHQAIAMAERPELAWGIDACVSYIRRNIHLAQAYELPSLVVKIASKVSRSGVLDRRDYKAFLKESDQLCDDPHQRMAYERFFNLGAWLEAMLDRKPIHQTNRARLSQADDQAGGQEMSVTA